MAEGTFFTVMVDGTVLDSYQAVDGEASALQQAIASAETLARSGHAAEVYRNHALGDIGRPRPELVHTARASS
jgi:hypothetical protein